MPDTGECASSPIGSARLRHQLVRARDELPRNGVGRIIGIDQCRDLRRHRDRIARGDLLEQRKIGLARQTMVDQLFGLAQRPRQIIPVHCSAHRSSAGGVHTT
jgi:hypothetical protein